MTHNWNSIYSHFSQKVLLGRRLPLSAFGHPIGGQSSKLAEHLGVYKFTEKST